MRKVRVEDFRVTEDPGSRWRYVRWEQVRERLGTILYVDLLQWMMLEHRRRAQTTTKGIGEGLLEEYLGAEEEMLN